VENFRRTQRCDAAFVGQNINSFLEGDKLMERPSCPARNCAPGARQAGELDDADKADRLLRNLARRLDQEAPGVAASILEGLDEMLTANRLGLPLKLRRSLACTNSIENMMGTVRRMTATASR
jgi:transposase-like protein